ncbi:class I SAM-dependent methyltransferase [Pseudochelatococcus sp. B33]
MEYQFAHDWFSGHIPQWERLLAEFAGQPVRALEIGTHEGRSATWLLTNVLTHRRARLVCVDIFEQPVLRANLGVSGGHGKTTIKIGSQARYCPNSRQARSTSLTLTEATGHATCLKMPSSPFAGSRWAASSASTTMSGTIPRSTNMERPSSRSMRSWPVMPTRSRFWTAACKCGSGKSRIKNP